MKVLLSCFDSFAGFKENSSQLVLKKLLQNLDPADLIQSVTLPTSFSSSFPALASAITEFQPDLVLCLAQAAARNQISLEAQARNLTDSGVSDNGGQTILCSKIIDGGSEILQSPVSLTAISNELDKLHPGIVGVSTDAGSFVCNHLYYQLLHLLRGSKTRPLLIHLPLAAEQKDAENACFALPAQQMAQIVNRIIETLRKL